MFTIKQSSLFFCNEGQAITQVDGRLVDIFPGGFFRRRFFGMAQTQTLDPLEVSRGSNGVMALPHDR